jgi:hypothetical protein
MHPKDRTQQDNFSWFGGSVGVYGLIISWFGGIRPPGPTIAVEAWAKHSIQSISSLWLVMCTKGDRERSPGSRPGNRDGGSSHGQVESLIPHLVDGGVSILQYADDTTIFMENNLENALSMKIISLLRNPV